MDDRTPFDLTNDEWERARVLGDKEIRRAWRHLELPTRAWLQSTGKYDERGAHRSVAGAQGGKADESDRTAVDEIRWDKLSELSELQTNLGWLRLCLNSPYADRTKLAKEAMSGQELSAARAAVHELAVVHPAHDAVFLRIALSALHRLEMDRLVCMLPLFRTHSAIGGIIRLASGLLFYALLLASPAVAVNGFIAMFKADSYSATMAAYALGFTAFLGKILYNIGKPDTPAMDERTYLAWQSLLQDHQRNWTENGAGAAAYLENMLRQGLDVPVIALDLCARLRERSSLQTKRLLQHEQLLA